MGQFKGKSKQFGGGGAGHALALLLAIPIATGSAGAVCLEVAADVNADGTANISDVQCQILSVLYDLGGYDPDDEPSCVGPGFKLRTDPNCDFTLDVSDVLVTINQALELGVDPELDTNLNGCVDACEPVFVDCSVAPDLTPCEDGDICTAGDFCAGGDCLSGTAVACTDDNPCTVFEDCTPETGCTAVFELSCNDLNPCTLDACNPETGQCEHVYTPDATGCVAADNCGQFDDCKLTIPGWEDVCFYDPDECPALANYAGDCRQFHESCFSAVDSFPLEWGCDRSAYGTGDGCDCDCGAPDPDCELDQTHVYQCEPGAKCNEAGECEAPAGVAVVNCFDLQSCAGTLELLQVCDLSGAPGGVPLKKCSLLDPVEVDACNALLTACVTQ